MSKKNNYSLDASTEKVGKAEQAINNSTPDTTNQFPAVVALADPGPIAKRPRYCTGTLVTPHWVLTAAHCFLGGSGGGEYLRPMTSKVDIRFGADSDNPTFTVAHTFADNMGREISGPILTRINHPINIVYGDNIAADIALVRLDRPIRPFEAVPKHPSFEPNDCGESFMGTIVGYSGNTICNDPSTAVRDFSTSNGWSFSEANNGGFYTNQWIIGQCPTYNGPGRNDSGGPLFNADNDAFCGVASAYVPVLYRAYYSAINVSGFEGVFEGNADWIKKRIIDQFGNFEGECGAATTTNDPDGDDIPSDCDSCPTVFNPEQLEINDDLDEDGHGDACDFCPGLTVIDQTPNCNFETELAYVYPMLTAPPILNRMSFPSDAAFELARITYRNAFKPDACDPNPCPNQGFLNQPYNLQDQLPPDKTVDLPNPSSICGLATPCEWRVHNTVALLPYSTPPFLETISFGGVAPGGVGLRWCECDEGNDTTTLAGRVACRHDANFGCRVNAMDYSDMSSKWKPIATRADGGWTKPDGMLNPSDIGREFGVFFEKSPTQVTTTWDFLALGSNIVKVDPDNQPPTFKRVHGILWSHLLPLSPIFQIPPDQVENFSNTYQAGNGSVELVQSSATPLVAGTDIPTICSDCPEGMTDIFVATDYPFSYRVTTAGLDPVVRVAEEIRPIYAGIATGTTRLLVAEEPLGRLAQATLPGQYIVRGVVLDAAGDPNVVMGSLALDQSPVTIPRTAPFIVMTSTAEPVLNHREAMIFSGSKRHLLVVGGTVNGNPNGVPNDSAWIREVRPSGGDGPWVQIPLPVAERPGDILAATYRMDDRSVYLLDKKNGKIWLRRWEPFMRRPDGGEIKVLAQWPASWNGYDRFWISSGSEGDLLVTATRNQGGGPLQSRFVHLNVAKSGQVSIAGIASRAQKTITKPILTARGVTRTIPHASGARIETFFLTDFAMTPASSLPTLE